MSTTTEHDTVAEFPLTPMKAAEIIVQKHDALAEMLMLTTDAWIDAEPRLKADNLRKAVSAKLQESWEQVERALKVLLDEDDEDEES
jgi:hypothetical protein